MNLETVKYVGVGLLLGATLIVSTACVKSEPTQLPAVSEKQTPIVNNDQEEESTDAIKEDDQELNASESAKSPLDVDIVINPESISENDTFQISAKVTCHGQAVVDASEVKFELFKEGQTTEAHEKITAVHDKDGVYSIEKSIAKEGTYTVIAHVTAKDATHTMPQKQFVVSSSKSK